MSTYFLERGPHTSGAQLALRFPLPRFVVEGLTIEKRVTVQLNYESDGGDGHRLTIGWQPIGNGPLPDFAGQLSATPETAETSTLSLDGTYTPPGGIAGAIFDTVVGVRIARATINALLAGLKDAIDNDYRVRSLL